MALLVLHFVPDAPLAIREMRRVVKPGGMVAAVVWDHLGGMTGMRMIVDTLAALSEPGRQLRNRYIFQPMMQPGEMKQAFIDAGLKDVEETQLMARMDYANFDDLWAPIAAGEAPSASSSAISSRPHSTVWPPPCAMRTDPAAPTARGRFANVAWAVKGNRALATESRGRRTLRSRWRRPSGSAIFLASSASVRRSS